MQGKFIKITRYVELKYFKIACALVILEITLIKIYIIYIYLFKLKKYNADYKLNVCKICRKGTTSIKYANCAINYISLQLMTQVRK